MRHESRVNIKLGLEKNYLSNSPVSNIPTEDYRSNLQRRIHAFYINYLYLAKKTGTLQFNGC